MICPLILIRKEYSGVPTRLCKRNGITPRVLHSARDWKLKNIVRNLRSFDVQSHFIIDIGAIEETDSNEIITLLNSIKMQRDDAPIVIYAPENKIGDPILNDLVKAGFTNIIIAVGETDEEKSKYVTDMFERVLFDEGGIPKEIWEQMIIKEPEPIEEPVKTRKSRRTKETAVEQETAIVDETKALSYRNAIGELTFCGTQERIGTTTLALISAIYLSQRQGNVIFVCRNTAQLNELYKCLNVQSKQNANGSFTFYGVHFCDAVDDNNTAATSIVVRDAGLYGEVDKQRVGMLYLVGGIWGAEMCELWSAQQELAELDFTIAVNFTSHCKLVEAEESIFGNDFPKRQLFQIPFVPDKVELTPQVAAYLAHLYKSLEDSAT